MKLTDLSNEALVVGLKELLGNERRLVAKLIAYLIEVEDRRLDRAAACSSLFDFCTRRLGLSEGEAFRRITAARLARRFPTILGRIERGEIHLSALVLLREHLTDQNHEALLNEVAGRTKRAVHELLATRFSKPDIAASIRKLPAHPTKTIGTTTRVPEPTPTLSMTESRVPVDVTRRQPGAVVPESAKTAPATPLVLPTTTPRPKAVIEPLSPARYKVQLTASSELRDKIERATQLMSHRNPGMDLPNVIERALDLLIAQLEKERLGATARPRASKMSSANESRVGYVPRAARREVVARDGEQCTFVAPTGERCPARAFLEFDHTHPRALGGTSDVSNLRLRCRAHNGLAAELAFGREHVEQQIRLRREKSASRSTRGKATSSLFRGHVVDDVGDTGQD